MIDTTIYPGTTEFSTTSPLTLEVCRRLGYRPEVRFVETRIVKGKIIVSWTGGKRDEIYALRQAARFAGFWFECAPGRVLRPVDPKVIEDSNR